MHQGSKVSVTQSGTVQQFIILTLYSTRWHKTATKLYRIHIKMQRSYQEWIIIPLQLYNVTHSQNRLIHSNRTIGKPSLYVSRTSVQKWNPVHLHTDGYSHLQMPTKITHLNMCFGSILPRPFRCTLWAFVLPVWPIDLSLSWHWPTFEVIWFEQLL